VDEGTADGVPADGTAVDAATVAGDVLTGDVVAGDVVAGAGVDAAAAGCAASSGAQAIIPATHAAASPDLARVPIAIPTCRTAFIRCLMSR
jgi:hypothetical protein